MKKYYTSISLLLLLIFIFAGCDQSENKEIIDTRVEIRLNKQLATVDANTSDKIHIISGNGGYKIIFPKKISIGKESIDYSSKILEVRIDYENNITIKHRLSLDDNRQVSGMFMVTDSKGAKKLFIVDPRDIAGNLYDFNEIQKKYQDDPNYWQK